jgi:murein DD-endopeptidase MepM/ murein hydrolase activator NlpD
LSQGQNRTSQHGRSHEWRSHAAIDLGNEPPLSVDGSEGGVIDRRRISMHWFSGTILTGLCGAALIGGAVFTSLDGETTFAAMPEIGDALRGALTPNEKTAPVARKSDRLPPPNESTATRKIVKFSNPTKVGDREVMRVRPFIHIAGNLSLSTSELSSKIPPFNPQRLMADVDASTPAQAQSEDSPDTAGAEPDAEVSFVTRDLASLLPRVKIAANVPMEDVVMQVRDASSWQGTSGEGVRYAVASVQPGMKLSFAAEGTNDPYAGFEARIVPENVTMLPKTGEQAKGGNPVNEIAHIVKKGENLASILRKEGASAEEIRAIAIALGNFGREDKLKEGLKLRILMSPIDSGAKLHPVRVIVMDDTTIEAVAAYSDLGKYVAVDVASLNETSQTADNASSEDSDDGSGVRLYQSIYETALRNKIPMPIINDMVRIYSYDVDFQRRAQPGDSFKVFYAGEEEGAPHGTSTRNEVLFTSLTVGGETKKYYRYQSPDDGVVDYYDESGKSAKKFLIRKPVTAGLMRSGFGSRRHPILGYTKMHTGVDWAAPYGTPIFAAGNGTVEKAGWEGGYGKYVRIQHTNGYETAYGHMTAFAKGIQPGKTVRQGQVIGYVGSTGLSTGAHVHYEVLINARFVDPMRIRLPRGRSLSGTMLATFEKERDRVDGMMQTRGTPRVAQNTAPGGR